MHEMITSLRLRTQMTVSHSNLFLGTKLQETNVTVLWRRAKKTSKQLESLRWDSLTKEQEQIFKSILKCKLRCSSSGLVQAKNVRGRPTNLVQIRTVEVGSAEASCSTVRQRSKFQERLESICSTPADNQTQTDVNNQSVSLTKRNKQG